MYITPQVLPAPANNRQEDIPPLDRGVAEPGRMQDQHHIDYQGIIDYHPQPPAVSNFRPSVDGPLFDQ